MASLFLAMDFEQSQKRWVGMGHGHVGAGLGRMRKDCSEKCPKKNKQEPWRQLALCESEEALATVTCSSCTLRVRLDGPSSPDLTWRSRSAPGLVCCGLAASRGSGATGRRENRPSPKSGWGAEGTFSQRPGGPPCAPERHKHAP